MHTARGSLEGSTVQPAAQDDPERKADHVEAALVALLTGAAVLAGYVAWFA